MALYAEERVSARAQAPLVMQSPRAARAKPTSGGGGSADLRKQTLKAGMRREQTLKFDAAALGGVGPGARDRGAEQPTRHATLR